MRIEQIKVYEYKELNDEAKEKALDDFRKGQDFFFLEKDMDQELEYQLEEHKITHVKNKELGYSLSNCQGDGVNFVGTFKWKRYIVTIVRRDYHYSHKHTTDISVETNYGNEAKEEIFKEFQELYYTICDHLEKYGYNQIEHESSEEYIKDFFEINEISFTEDGSVF